MIPVEKIYANLRFGYDPGCSHAGIPDVVRKAVESPSINGSEQYLVNRGSRAFMRAVDSELERVSDYSQHIVPLSSGLDSRAILAALIQNPKIEKENIHTLTFGSPRTWDYELSQDVAEAAGVSNETVNLSGAEFDWSFNTIQDYANSKNKISKLLDGYINSKITDKCGDRSVVWSGFMGDPSAGGHYPSVARDDWFSSQRHFVKNEQYTGDLVPDEFDPYRNLPDSPYMDKDVLSYEEQLDFAHRQRCLIWPIVIQSSNYLTPFMNLEWLEFGLNLQIEDRRDRSLFKKIMQRTFPNLFKIGTDANQGLPLGSSSVRHKIRTARLLSIEKIHSVLNSDYTSPDTNYVNFGAAFRNHPELARTAKRYLLNFETRPAVDWFSPMEVWQDHQCGKDKAKEILAIMSVESQLKKSEQD